MSGSGGDVVHVVAAAIVGPDDRILIAQRPAGKHLAGGWEFPGGKLEPGEQRRAGLLRELREELGIEIQRCRPLLRLHHAYADRRVLLDVWLVDRFSGVPAGLDGQALRWCGREQLSSADLLPADRPVVTALRLPPILDRSSTDCYELVPGPLDGAARGRSADARLLGVICPSPPAAAQMEGADFIVIDAEPAGEELAAFCEEAGRPVFVRAASVEDAWKLGAIGLFRGDRLS